MIGTVLGVTGASLHKPLSVWSVRSSNLQGLLMCEIQTQLGDGGKDGLGHLSSVYRLLSQKEARGQRCETRALQGDKAGYLSKFSPGLFFLHSSMCN